LKNILLALYGKNQSKLYAIYANPEHVHFLISLTPSMSEVEMATIFADSAECFIDENKLSQTAFQWQQSASAFSVPKSDIDTV